MLHHQEDPLTRQQSLQAEATFEIAAHRTLRQPAIGQALLGVLRRRQGGQQCSVYRPTLGIDDAAGEGQSATQQDDSQVRRAVAARHLDGPHLHRGIALLGDLQIDAMRGQLGHLEAAVRAGEYRLQGSRPRRVRQHHPRFGDRTFVAVHHAAKGGASRDELQQQRLLSRRGVRHGDHGGGKAGKLGPHMVAGPGMESQQGEAPFGVADGAMEDAVRPKSRRKFLPGRRRQRQVDCGQGAPSSVRHPPLQTARRDEAQQR